MFSKLLEVIKEALQKMADLIPTQKQSIDIMHIISKDMQNAIEMWTNIYEEKAPWLNIVEDITSLGIAGEVCSELARSVTLEMQSNILDTEEGAVDNVDLNGEPTTRAEYLNKTYHNKLLNQLQEKLEYGMATGGMIIKPYVSNNQIYFDFACQGEFIPIDFDDDGNITDIAFPDSFISNGKRYTKVERHIYSLLDNTVTVINKAFVSDDIENTDDLGKEIPLSQVTQWASISEEPIVIENVEHPLYGFYKFPRANNVDKRSPLGASAFSRAIKIIEKADRQFSRLDWEYDAGQMAVDADPTVINPERQSGYYGSPLDQTRQRVYRGIDVDDMYSVFAPALRDANYLSGLNTYLVRIEDLCELSRGTISNAELEARTATEILTLKQRAYSNISRNQEALENCLNAVIYAMNVYCDLYELFTSGEYTVSHNWDDSVITDRGTQLEEKMLLCNDDIISKAEVRAWYTGETVEKAQEMIDTIQDSKPDLANDLFGSGNVDDSQEDEE